jgi:hypothetical protein
LTVLQPSCTQAFLFTSESYDAAIARQVMGETARP